MDDGRDRRVLNAQIGVRFQKLSESQCAQIHAASLRLLETVGMQVHHERARDVLRAGGAVVEGERVRIGPDLVNWALQTSPRSFTLHDRAGHPAMDVGGTNVFFGVGSETPYIIDHRTNERRRPTLEDVAEGSRLVDALPNIDFLMSLFCPWDMDPEVSYLHQFKAMLANSTKPSLFLCPQAGHMKKMVEMLEAVVGGADELRARPRGMAYANVTHPFRHEWGELEKALFLAEKAVPFVYNPTVLRGANSPITIAAGHAVANAGELLGLVLSQLVNPGCPIALSGGTVDKMDMRTMIDVYSAPENRVTFAEIARFYDKPHFGLGGGSDSKLVDGQAAAEAALSLLTEASVGSNLIHDVGYMESGMSNSLAQIVICDDIIGWVRRFLEPIEVSEETLALDLVERVAPEGDYVSEEHTLAHFGEDWYPNVFDHRTHDKWHKAGGLDLTARAGARVDRLLAAHVPEPLAEAVLARLDAIIAG